MSESSPFEPAPLRRPLSTRAKVFRAAARLATNGAWKRLVSASQAPREAATAKLGEIVARNRDTAFGREHGFGAIRTIEDYQRAVPPRDFEGLSPWLDRVVAGERAVLTQDEPTWFGQSSGTTGKPKLIPITPSYFREFILGRTLFARALAENLPQLADGAELGMASPKVQGHTPGGVPYGSITGKIEAAKPRWVREGDTYPLGLFELEDFERKYYLLLRLALENRITRIHTANPSTVVLLARKLDEYSDALIRDLEHGTADRCDGLDAALVAAIRKRIRAPNRALAEKLRRAKGTHGRLRPPDVWDEFAAVLCWKGGSAPFYLQQFPHWFGDDVPVHEIGYAATEGSFTVPLSARGNDGVLVIPAAFVEFLPEDARDRGDYGAAVDASRVEVGGRYFTLLTTSAGLYRYDINDLVEITGFFHRAPKLKFLHKGGNMLSITGEKLGESHVVEAMRNVQLGCGIQLAGFTVSVDLAGLVPRYLFYVEAPGLAASPRLRELLHACDAELQRTNLEYEAKRSSLRLANPSLVVVPEGSYDSYRKKRVAAGAPDAHVKALHLARDRAIPDAFGVAITVEWE